MSFCLYDLVKNFGTGVGGVFPGWGCRGAQHPPARATGAKRDFFMKTYRNFYPQIYDFDNLYRAYTTARRGKRGTYDVMRFEQQVEDKLFRLQAELRDQTYRPGAYRHFYIYEPKKRGRV